MAKDYYSILGVKKDASQDEIKSAYRKLAKKYHPDANPNNKEQAEEKIKECNEAYAILGDPEKRAKYDRGEMDFEGFSGFNGQGGFSGFGGFGDIFSDIFGGFSGGRRTSASQDVGNNIRFQMTISFMEAVKGCTKTISFTRTEKCPTCNGSGAKDASSVKTCDNCKGTGQIRYMQNTLFGQQMVVGTCDKCRGSGKIITDTCKACSGKGLTSKSKKLNVKVPFGVENGETLILNGEGNAVSNGQNGNVEIKIFIAQSKVFKRNKLDLYVDVPVPYTTAVNGGEIEIPGIDGVFIHKLKDGTQNGESLFFRGKGIKKYNGGTGDLYATIVVEVPKQVSKNQKKILDEYERDMSIKNYPKRKQYLDEITKLYK